MERAAASRDEILLASRDAGAGLRQTDLSLPGMHCGGCIRTIEAALLRLPGVEAARANLSSKRVGIRWSGDASPPLIETLGRIGYDAHLFAPETGGDKVMAGLIRALAVAGFAAGNIMALSVAIWAGADPATRDLFHWISAAIALPAVAYAGSVFFRPAWRSLSRFETNMDVPVSIGVLLATGLSLYETMTGGEHAYFDASVSLLFFLLAGRALDHAMRERARDAVKGLERLVAHGAMILHPDGGREYLPVDEIAPGMVILLAAGERVPVDATVEDGTSDLDMSLVTGESAPKTAGPGARLLAGTLNLTHPLAIRAGAAAKDSFLAEMVRLMEAAEGGRGRYRRIADRAARLYAPAVHLTAVLAFAGWLAATGDWHRAITIAIAVLIVTCPCALGLAVPMVQVVAAGRLFRHGIMVRDGSAMERMALVDTVVFDKTGTLTLGELRLKGTPRHLSIAAALSARSLHPNARALCRAATGLAPPAQAFDTVTETPGLGLEGRSPAGLFRLGRAQWALDAGGDDPAGDDTASTLACNGALLATFSFEDGLRPEARRTIDALRALGLDIEMISGDQPRPVARIAATLGIGHFMAGATPADKTAHLAALEARGRKILMVGDGLNDAPALIAASVSMAPASAADVGRNAADFVFLRPGLDAVRLAVAISRAANRLVAQNFMLAIGYNAVAIPFAIRGDVTPLVAALAMSLSSITVVANALRLGGDKPVRASSPRSAASAAATEAAR